VTEPAALSLALADDLGKDRGQMAALVGAFVSSMSARPFLYSVHTGRLTDAGRRVTAHYVRELHAMGTLDYHLAETQRWDSADA
jgi:hypothetical protein